MATKKFFVYGTLKVGGVLATQFDTCRKKCVKATLPNYALYDLGWFPGILKNTGEEVFGEIHTYDDDDFDYVLGQFDRIEGYHEQHKEQSLYLREVVSVVDEDNNTVDCNCYVFNKTDGAGNKLKKVAEKTWDITNR